MNLSLSKKPRRVLRRQARKDPCHLFGGVYVGKIHLCPQTCVPAAEAAGTCVATGRVFCLAERPRCLDVETAGPFCVIVQKLVVSRVLCRRSKVSDCPGFFCVVVQKSMVLRGFCVTN